MPDDAPATPHAELEAELSRLRGETARLARLARQLSASAEVQGLRAGARSGQADHMRHQMKLMQSSKLWRVTWPLRLAIDLARGAPPDAGTDALRVRRALETARRIGFLATAARLRRELAGRMARRRRRASRPIETAEPARPSAPDASAAPDAPAASVSAAMAPPMQVLAPSVLIVAELTLPQCAKYRVWQKQELIESLGRPCRVVDWRFTYDCLSAAALATQVILYRVPAYPVVLHLIDRLHRLGVPVAWEVDDLIFDRTLFLQNRNIDTLDQALRDSVLSGVALYRDAMLACGAGIASTPCLADIMRDAGLNDVTVIENALDRDTLEIAGGLRRARHAATPGSVLITYGSGTKTHDADFREAAPALLRLLAKRPDIRLRIVGELTLPPGFEAFAGRVERLPPVPYPLYLGLLSASDISIAPLEPTPFNDAKSNIKFIEAAILGVPSVCSPRAHFTHVMQDGQDGLFADGEQAWFTALSALADDPALRTRLGQAALQTARRLYEPDAIARTQVRPLLARTPDGRRPVALRTVLANVYFAPRSYGGATLVVEEMARRLHARDDTEVHVVTGSLHDESGRAITRSEQDGMAVFALPVADGDVVAEFDDPEAGAAFGKVLDAVQPHVVHLHAVQWLSASLAAACTERDIPYVITLHDAWWLCARQFMVQENGKYCFQTTIDLHVCQNCVAGARHLTQRDALLRAALDGAALLLSPSEAHRRLYLANGIAPDRIEVAPNGVRLPARRRAARPPGAPLRFAYVGGNVEVKGYSIVRQAFAALARTDWRLVVVDNTLNLGFSSINAADWAMQGRVSIVPAYTQDGIEDFFDGIDVLLFPSQWKESFGLTVREALVRDVWVVATDGGGPAEAITDGVNGTLIPLDGRHESLLQAIERLLDSPAMFDGFVNPHAGAVMDYASQAEQLRATLAQVAARHAAGTRS